MSSRDEILADFQACTGVEDLEIAISKLESVNWNLLDAVNNELSVGEETTAGVTESIVSATQPQVVDITDTDIYNQQSSSVRPVTRSSQNGTNSSNDVTTPTKSSGSGRMLDFYITHHDETHHIKLRDYETVSTLQSLIQSETSFPPCQQTLLSVTGGGSSSFHNSSPFARPSISSPFSTSFPTASVNFSNPNTQLSDLNLAKETFLQLVTPETSRLSGSAKEENASSSPTDYKLSITDVTKSKTFILNFRPNQTLSEIKMDISHLTNISVSHQVWTGWPPSASENSTLTQMFPQNKTSSSHPILTVDCVKISLEPSSASASSSRILSTDDDDEVTIVDSVQMCSRSSTSSASSKNVPRNASIQRSRVKDDVMDVDVIEELTIDSKTNESSDSEESDGVEEIIGDEDEEEDEHFFDIDMIGRSGVNDDPSDGNQNVTNISGGGSAAVSKYLISESVGEDASAAGREFSQNFMKRYGSPSPFFFPDSLDQSLNESCLKSSPKERKPLFLYFHHDFSVLVNLFCSQVLCTDSIVTFLTENFLCFGWDCTHPSNRLRISESMKKHFGSMISSKIRTSPENKFPMMAVATKVKNNLDIQRIIYGEEVMEMNELMSELLTTHENYSSERLVEIGEEEERVARHAMRNEQDIEFQMAQLVDEQKEIEERQKRENDEEQRQLEQVCKQSAKEAKIASIEAKRRKEMMLSQQLPPQPSDHVRGVTTKIRFRVVGEDEESDDESDRETIESNETSKDDKHVSGEQEKQLKMFERIFDLSNALNILFLFLSSKGFQTPRDYKVITSWPRRDLTTLEEGRTLSDLQLCFQETITVERR